MVGLKETPSQTAGPYVHIGCVPETAGLEQRGLGPQLGTRMVSELSEQQRITLEICVYDGAGDPVKDALIEIWQATPDGGYAPTETFSNWGRQATDLTTGRAMFETLKPGAALGEAPHVFVWIVARGINLGLMTRIYFPDEENATDPVYALAQSRAGSMVAQRTETGYSHAIHLQGPTETVFFDV